MPSEVKAMRYIFLSLVLLFTGCDFGDSDPDLVIDPSKTSFSVSVRKINDTSRYAGEVSARWVDIDGVTQRAYNSERDCFVLCLGARSMDIYNVKHGTPIFFEYGYRGPGSVQEIVKCEVENYTEDACDFPTVVNLSDTDMSCVRNTRC